MSGFKRLSGRVVVVTGASSGNGAAIARLLAKQAATLVLAARGAEGLARIQAECTAAGSRTLCVQVDTGVEDQVNALAQKAVESFGGIDAWVNCAAVLAFGRIEDIPAEDLERLVRTNLLGCVFGTRAAVRQFRRQRCGTLVNISSVLGTVGAPYAAAYSATKWAIRGLTKSVRDELRDERHVHACTVLPAAMDTPIFRNAANYRGLQPRAPEPVYSPERVAAAVLSLLRRPRREVYVGGFAYLPRIGHAIFPSLTERISAAYMARRQFEYENHVAPGHGNLHHPTVAERLGRGGYAPLLWDRLERPVMIGSLLAAVAAILYGFRRR